MSADRTEQPTAKRLKDAREKGQVARSRDLAVAVALLTATIAIGRLGGRLVAGLGDHLRRGLEGLAAHALTPIAGGDLRALVADGAWAIVSLVGPIALGAAVVGAFVQGVQGGFAFAPAALELKWDRLSPAQGFRRFAFAQSGADTIKTLIVGTALVSVAWAPIAGAVAAAPQLAWMPAADAAHLAWQSIASLIWRAGLALTLVSLADYGLQRYRLLSSLKMTKQEVRDELRQTEGSPEIKGRIRRLQREMAKRRMLQDVPRATVVVTNPTHFAVALEYRRGAMSAPVVLAKGSDHLAARIRERARQAGVPIVENKPLAQALFKTADVGDAIPAPLFAAVAEVLAQLIRLKQLVL